MSDETQVTTASQNGVPGIPNMETSQEAEIENENDDVNTNDEPGENKDDEFSLQEVERCYFAPDVLASEAMPYLEKIESLNDVKITRNFDPEKEFPENYGLGIVPITKRSDTGKGNVTIGVCVAAIPDVSLVAEHDKGSEFIRNTVHAFFLTKIANAARPKNDGTSAGSLPFSLDSFLEKREKGEGLKTFTALAPDMVKSLRKRGLKLMTAFILRQVLSSKAFAETQFPKIEQESWLHVIDVMIKAAREKKLDPQVFITWKETRDSATAEEEEFDLTDLGDLT